MFAADIAFNIYLLKLQNCLQIINTEHSRTIINLKNQLATAKKVAVMIDVLKLNTSTSSAALSASVDDKVFVGKKLYFFEILKLKKFLKDGIEYFLFFLSFSVKVDLK